MLHALTFLGFLDVGGGEMLMIFFIALLLFGGQKLPEFARGAGKAIRDFKKAASGVEEEIKRAMEEPRPSFPPPPVTPIPALLDTPAETPLALTAAVEASTDSSTPADPAEPTTLPEVKVDPTSPKSDLPPADAAPQV